jgi:hypothetical protein
MEEINNNNETKEGGSNETEERTCLEEVLALDGEFASRARFDTGSNGASAIACSRCCACR